LATNADASVVDYAAVRVGQATNTAVEGISFSDDMTYGVAVGKAVGPFRVEVGANRISGDLNYGGPVISGDAMDFHASAFLDFNISERTSVYVGGGADYVNAEADIFGYTINGDGYGYNFAVGAAHRFNDHVIGEAQFRRLNADLSTDFGDVTFEGDQITLGIRVN